MQLNEKIKSALRGPYSNSRSCTEKNFAHALIVGGITKVSLSSSYWCGRPPGASGLLINKRSIETYFEPTTDQFRPILWQILDYLKIPFSGGADSSKGFAQASWLIPISDRDINKVDSYYKVFDLAMVVLYFQELYQFKREDNHLLF